MDAKKVLTVATEPQRFPEDRGAPEAPGGERDALGEAERVAIEALAELGDPVAASANLPGGEAQLRAALATADGRRVLGQALAVSAMVGATEAVAAARRAVVSPSTRDALAAGRLLAQLAGLLHGGRQAPLDDQRDGRRALGDLSDADLARLVRAGRSQLRLVGGKRIPDGAGREPDKG